MKHDSILQSGQNVCTCAQIYAQNAIRKKNEALNYMRLGSRLDAVVSRLDTQAKMQVSGSLLSLVLNASPAGLCGNCSRVLHQCLLLVRSPSFTLLSLSVLF